MHTCTHAHMHTCTHTHIHTYTHTYLPTYLHTYIHTYIYIYVYIECAFHGCFPPSHFTKDMSFQNLVAKVEAERREQERLSEVKKKDQRWMGNVGTPKWMG